MKRIVGLIVSAVMLFAMTATTPDTIHNLDLVQEWL